MTHWTESQLHDYEQKQAPDAPESSLSKKIRQWAKDNGYPALVCRQSIKARGFLTPGWPDVTLVLPERVVFLELKGSKGTLRENQKLIAQQMLTLGHEWHKVKTWREFMEIVREHIIFMIASPDEEDEVLGRIREKREG